MKDQKAKDSNWVEPWVEKRREAERAAGNAPSVRKPRLTFVQSGLTTCYDTCDGIMALPAPPIPVPVSCMATPPATIETPQRRRLYVILFYYCEGPW